MLKYTICFVRRGDQVLLLNRSRAPWMGMWNGVGGKIEAGESPLQGILREVREETGIELKAARFAGIVTWTVDGGRPDGMYAFVADVSENLDYPTPRAVDEGVLDWKDLTWVLNSDNLGVVSLLPRYLPAMLAGVAGREHHFIFNADRKTEYVLRPLPAENPPA
ncbi:MAG: 8-oxo-dGTP diphosphatase [Firmicutes bacterium]|nr:8-oxo-dGTP diphosphatase [Bacillota bacterium]